MRLGKLLYERKVAEKYNIVSLANINDQNIISLALPDHPRQFFRLDIVYYRATHSGSRTNKGMGQHERRCPKRRRDPNEMTAEEWDYKERAFILKQSFERAHLRITENRGFPIDYLVINTGTARESNLLFAGSCLDFVDALEDSELKQLSSDIETHIEIETNDKALGFWQHLLAYVGKKSESSKSPVIDDIKALLAPKTAEQLESMEKAVKKKLESGIVDVDYWENLLKQVDIYKIRFVIKELFEELSHLRREEIRKSPEKVGFEHFRSRIMQPNSTNFTFELPRGDLWDNCPAAIALYKTEVSRKLQKEEVVFNVEADDVPPPVYSWESKYPRKKPRFYNLVLMNYDWNKYNQAHYTIDNPPPKIVQGYRFNVIYPDLVDKTKTPTYKVEDDPANPEMQLLRFIGGAPYGDLVFRIEHEEWDCSHRQDFICVFERDVLRLHFWFRRQRYRR